MSLEETDTTNTFEKDPMPDGEHELTVVYVSRVEKVKGMYEWQFALNGAEYIHAMFSNEMGDLLRVLGCKETSKNKFSWDTVMVEKGKFLATVSHLPDKKDPTIMRQRLSGFKKVPGDDDIQF